MVAFKDRDEILLTRKGIYRNIYTYIYNRNTNIELSIKILFCYDYKDNITQQDGKCFIFIASTILFGFHPDAVNSRRKLNPVLSDLDL